MEDSHPIEGLMETAMESLKAMVDVNTILGDPVETPDGCVILPVSRVSFGFAAGGSEFDMGKKEDVESSDYPFGGGSGGGISLNPVAFLVVGNNQVRLLPVDNSVIFDRLIDMVPQVVDQIQGTFKRKPTTPANNSAYDLGPIRN